MDRKSRSGGASRHLMQRKERRREEPQSRILRVLRGAGIGLLTGLLFSLLLLVISAGILLKSEDPDALLLPVSLSVLFISSILVGIVSEKASNAPFLPTGLTAAVLWLLVTLLASLAFEGGNGVLPTVYAWALRIPQLLFVLFGSFLAKNRPRRVDPRRRRR